MPETPAAYRLCQWCSEREGQGDVKFEPAPPGGCFVCAGLMDTAATMAKRAVTGAKGYQFETFAVGVSFPGVVQEREDELRSDLKLKGNETVKTQAARLVSRQVAEALHKRIDRQRPDLSLLVDFGEGKVTAMARPVFFYGRYSKPAGIVQRRLYCQHCGGDGCKKCRNTGFEQRQSVEGLLGKKLVGFAGSGRVTFTWLGSEDRESKVYPPGRPFVAELKNPRKRKLPRKFGARSRGGLVSVTLGKVLPSKPLRLPSFKFATSIVGVAAAKVSPDALRDLQREFRNASVTFARPNNRPSVKTVYRAAAKVKGRSLLIDAELDGGLPVKRFVSGELVSPSVSEVLKTEVRCRTFDIRKVKETGEFEFAEITRIKEKDPSAP